MIRGMTVVKRAVSLEEDVDREARALSGGNFSAFVNAAVRRHVRAVRLAQLVAEDSEQRGPLPTAMVEAVDAELADLDE